MRQATKAALSDWRTEAARLAKEREGEPGAFTTKEFAEASGMGLGGALNYLSRRPKQYRKSKKVIGNKVIPAWVMIG